MMYQSSSLSRFDNVRRRQLMRMKKRSNWFLANTPTSQPGSREPSVGKSSLDASSDALMSDVTSDFGVTDTPMSDRLRLSSDGGSFLDDSYRTHLRSSSLEAHRSRLQQPDLINGNHTMASTSSSRGPSPRHSTPSPSVTDKDVRYFMVENCYEASSPHSTS